ncbi:MAG TPA: carboxymuconolactone decarboxylase family protein [Acetobacteraceae bacterium]|nr:carboxymuconolactone decarboxylase family protein [Acetobacteraceae bacterium]
MTGPKPRIPRIPTSEWSAEAHAAYDVMESEATRSLGRGSNLGTVFANHPALAKAYYTLGRHLLIDSSIPQRLRELVTLRVAWHHKSEYEWCHHVRFGKRIGLTDAEIEAVREGPAASIWSGADRCVLDVTDQLCTRSRIDDAGWDELGRFLDRHQAMDLIVTIGHYVMTAWAIAAFGVQIEPGFDTPAHPLT